MDAGLTMSEYRSFESVAIGDVFPPEPLEFVVSDEVVDRFLAATANDSASYAKSDGQGRAPSLIAAVYLIRLLSARQSPPGGIHAKQTLKFHRAARRGETLTVQGRFVDKYIRKDRPYVVADFEARGGDGSLVSSGRVTSIWGRSS